MLQNVWRSSAKPVAQRLKGSVRRGRALYVRKANWDIQLLKIFPHIRLTRAAHDIE